MNGGANKIAILLQSGFNQAPWPTDSAGMYDLADMLCARFDSRSRSWIGVRPFDANLSRDVRNIKKFNPDAIVHIGHSFGVGVGLMNFARELEFQGMLIDLACAIDPVPYAGLHFVQTEEPFLLPGNVVDAMGFRTLNQPPLHPWGRRIQSVIPGSIIREVTFGADVADSDTITQRFIRDAIVTHSNIDNDSRVQDEILAAIDRLEVLSPSRPVQEAVR